MLGHYLLALLFWYPFIWRSVLHWHGCIDSCNKCVKAISISWTYFRHSINTCNIGFLCISSKGFDSKIKIGMQWSIQLGCFCQIYRCHDFLCSYPYLLFKKGNCSFFETHWDWLKANGSPWSELLLTFALNTWVFVVAVTYKQHWSLYIIGEIFYIYVYSLPTQG